MCGLTGFRHLTPGPDGDTLATTAAAMADTLAHRGPDGAGTWVDPAAGVALGHRRLAIRDLSPAGAQPMVSACGRYVLAYNGELYGLDPLADALRAGGVVLRGHSDTEVLVEACAALGVAATLARINGMFAFALWDRRDDALYLARDRFGIKPLFWGRQGDTLFFASELKALAAHPAFTPALDREAVALFLRHGYVPAPWAIHAGINKLRPGTFVRLAADGTAHETVYWDTVAEARHAPPGAEGVEAAADALDATLRDAVAERLVADVPVGAFLSGGIDSTMVVALMQALADRPVHTCSVGFADSGLDEADDAARVAAHLGTEHHAFTVTADDALAVVPDLPRLYDEPFADASQIPTYLLCRAMRQRATVALSGDGGDELFAGYNRHHTAAPLWQRAAAWPRPARRLAAAGLRALPPRAWTALADAAPGRLPSGLGDKVHKAAAVLDAPDSLAAYRRLVAAWTDPAALVKGAGPPAPGPGDTVAGAFAHPVTRFQVLDSVGYLPDDILTKVDRAGMAVGLEVRVPFLDPRVARLAWGLPPGLHVRGGRGKWLLRQVLARYVPPALVERPKQGFDVPLAAWLRGPLRDWAADLLAPERLARQDLLNPAPVQTLWAEHRDGRADHQDRLWPVLMLQAWVAETEKP